jgi:hypothetical protein
MARRLFRIAGILSGVIALAVAASWVRSYWVYDQISCGHQQCAWTSYSAPFEFTRWPPAIPEGASSALLTSFGKISLRQAVYSEEPRLDASSRGYGWSSDENVIPSFSYSYAVTSDMSRSGHWTVRQISIRHWALVLLFAVFPVAWVLGSRRRRRRQSSWK